MSAVAESSRQSFKLFRRKRDEGAAESHGLRDRFSDLVKIILFLAIINAGTGIWACTQSIDPFIAEGVMIQYKIPGKLMLFSGALVATTSFVTIIEVTTLTRLAAICLIRALSPVIFIEAFAGAMAFGLGSSVYYGCFNKTLLIDLQEGYFVDTKVTYTVEEIHKTFNCCGVEGPEDWLDSSWAQMQNESEDIFPSICCAEEEECNYDHITYTGCGRTASEMLYAYLLCNYRCAFITIPIYLTSLLCLSFLQKKA